MTPTIIFNSVLGPGSWAGVFLGILVFPVLSALVKVVPLTIVAVLAGRRVTPLRVLGLLASSIVVMAVQTGLGTVGLHGQSWFQTLTAFVLEVSMMIVLGALAAALYPPAAGRADRWVPVLAAVAVVVLSDVQSWVSDPGPDPVPHGGALVRAVVLVGWSIAVLVTSSQVARETAVQAADQGRQDP
ncbi:MAG TPA: hypothetical protein VN408_17460 [Actinoplanes sp.]|nr:hypothetical protein [Actinoplanes sp.]